MAQECGGCRSDLHIIKHIQLQRDDMDESILTDDLNIIYDKGIGSRLHKAAISNNVEVVRELLDSGADVDSIENYGETALTLAVKYKSLDTVRVLLDANADVFAIDAHGQSALQIAFYMRSDTTATTLIFSLLHDRAMQEIQRFGYEQISKKLIDIGFTLFHATFFNDVRILEYLLNNGIAINEKDPKDRDKAALHATVEMNNVDLAEWFLRKGANVNVRNKFGGTPLYLAALDYKRAFLRLLLDYGADPNIENFHKDTSPLDVILSQSDHLSYVELFLQHGAIPHGRYNNLRIVYYNLSHYVSAVHKYLVAALAILDKKSILNGAVNHIRLDTKYYYDSCSEILDTKVFRDLTLLNFLTDSDYKMRIHARNKTIVSSIQYICEKLKHDKIDYTYYYNTLTKRMKIAVDSVKLENAAIQIMCKIFDTNVNKCYVVARMIFSYLHKRDLEQLCKV